MHLNSLNHFRAIAIVLIVAGHSYDIAGLNFDSFLEKTAANLITGGTSLFVFISGFLFHHVFYKNFSYSTFFTNKLKNVLVPYLVLGALPVALHVMERTSIWNGHFLPASPGIVGEYVVPAAKYYWTGRFLTAYWYIPFIVITFALAPLHVRYIQLRVGHQLALITLMSTVSIFLHRPVDSVGLLQFVVYFAPMYLMGITCSIHKKVLLDAFSGKDYILFALVILFAALQAIFHPAQNYHKPAFVYGGPDLMFIQKVLMSLFLLVFLSRFEHLKNQALQTLADTSFTIFFIHPFVIYFVRRADIDRLQTDSWLVFTAVVAAVVLVCVAAAKLTRWALPRYSRQVVGY